MDQKGDIITDKKRFLELIACSPTTPRENLPSLHDDTTTKLEEYFNEYANTIEHKVLFSDDSRRSNDITAFRNKLQKYADEIVDPYDHEQHDKLETIISFLNQGLETWHKKKFKEFKKIKKIEKITNDIVQEIYSLVLELNTETIDSKPVHKERYVVVSESIV